MRYDLLELPFVINMRYHMLARDDCPIRSDKDRFVAAKYLVTLHKLKLCR